jgi:hypothetical protein
MTHQSLWDKPPFWLIRQVPLLFFPLLRAKHDELLEE